MGVKAYYLEIHNKIVTMELKVIKVEKDNDIEMLVMEVTEDCNLWPFIIFDSTYVDTQVSNLHRHSFIFPNLNVKANDFILLYTGRGENNHYFNRGGSTTWEFYWGLENNVWNQDEDEVLIVKAAEFKRFPY